MDEKCDGKLIREIKEGTLADCCWCGKKLGDKKSLAVWYHFLTLEEAISTDVEEYDGGRFCSWDCAFQWLQHRRDREGESS